MGRLDRADAYIPQHVHGEVVVIGMIGRNVVENNRQLRVIQLGDLTLHFVQLIFLYPHGNTRRSTVNPMNGAYPPHRSKMDWKN